MKWEARWRDVERLVAAYRAGDERAFEAVLEVLRPALAMWLKPWFAPLHSGSDRADLWQEARIAVWEAAERWEPGRTHTAIWLRLWVWSRMRDRLKVLTAQKRRVRLYRLDETMATGKPGALASALGRLSRMERAVLAHWLVYQRGARVQQSAIASALGLSRKAVDNALARAKKRLPRALEEVAA